MSSDSISRWNVAFSVQCEGAGHFTQALYVQNILKSQFQLDVRVVILNENRKSNVTDYFLKSMAPAEILFVKGPVLVRNSHNQSLDTVGCIWKTLLDSPDYIGSVDKVHEEFQKHKINYSFNFYDCILLLYMHKYQRSDILHINLATQFKAELSYQSKYTDLSAKYHCLEEKTKPPDIKMTHSVWINSLSTYMINNIYNKPAAVASKGTAIMKPEKLDTEKHTQAMLAVKGLNILQSPIQFHIKFTNSKSFFNYNIALSPFPWFSKTSNLNIVNLFSSPRNFETKSSNLLENLMSPLIELNPSSFYVNPCFVSKTQIKRYILPIAKVFPEHPEFAEYFHKPKTHDLIILVGYVNIPAFAEQLLEYCETYQQRKFHLFLFQKQDVLVRKMLPNLTYLQVSRNNFLTLLSLCDGFVGTAGVESICEAMMFKKPILAVPGINDLEQYTNSYLYTTNMQGIFGQTNFNLSVLLEYIAEADKTIYMKECKAVQTWLNQCESNLANILRHIIADFESRRFSQ